MRIIFLYFTMVFFAIVVQGQEKKRIDLDVAVSKTEPDVSTGSINSGIISSSPPPPHWKVDLLQGPGKSSKDALLEIRLTNVSALVLPVPLSQDGINAVKSCPDHTVLEETLWTSNKQDYMSNLQIAHFFGCNEMAETMVHLNPGEWITFVRNLPIWSLPEVIKATSRLTRMKYTQTDNGLYAEELENSIFRNTSSPWQTTVKRKSK